MQLLSGGCRHGPDHHPEHQRAACRRRCAGQGRRPGPPCRRAHRAAARAPQGCRTYLLAYPASKQALALDVHLDLVEEVARRVEASGWTLPYVVDSHTHADHPSGAAALAARFRSTRIAHAAGQHVGVTRHPADGDVLHLGDQAVTVRHALGHTPDHLVLLAGGALFSGDSLLIGSVARTDFLGGDAGVLFDTLQQVVGPLPDGTVLYPGHDYQGRISSTLGDERRGNPWLALGERAEFVRRLTANPPPRPVGMDALLGLNRAGQPIEPRMAAAEAVGLVARGAAPQVLDVRTEAEHASESIAGARLVPLHELGSRLDVVRAMAAPRLLLCRTGRRAAEARELLQRHGLGGLVVIEGGLEGWKAAGGPVERGAERMSLERQVRIAAGALVVLGTALGWFVQPGFFGLAAFVGAGLVFAGVTDTCAMGMLIARMPWNRVKGAAGAAAAGGGCAASGCSATPMAADAASTGGCAAGPRA
ncbi:MAG: rhodanese-like domain-containing protein [Planctomycetia bacterium]